MYLTGDNIGNFIDLWVGKQLRQLRLARGYQIDFIASLINLSCDEYECIERGDTCIGMTDLYTLSNFFNVDITDFFDDATQFLDELESKMEKAQPFPEDGLKLLRHFMNIKSPELRRSLLEQAEFFATRNGEPND